MRQTPTQETASTPYKPERIITAINYHGWTRKLLALKYGTDPSNISKIINGRLPFTEQVAERMTFATGFPVGFFMLTDRPVPVDRLCAHWPAHVRKSSVDRLVAEFTLLTGAATRLSSMTNTAPKCEWLEAISPRTALSVDAIESLAGEVRILWGEDKNGPIKHLVRALEQHGIMPVPLAAPMCSSDGNGITYPTYDNLQQIIGYFPEGKTGDRLRFTMAHELGHLILHRNRRPSSNQLAEVEANAFAGALLVPKRDALSAITPSMSLNDYAYVKAGWGVSIAALITRASRLGIIDSQRERSLRIQLSNRGWHRREPVEVQVEHPLLMKQLVGATFGPMEDYLHPTVSVRSVEGFLGLPFDMVNHWCDDGLTPIQDDFQLP